MRLPISTAKFEAITTALAGKIPYGWGHKADPSWDWHVFLAHCAENGVDCSGWIAWVVFQSSEGHVHLTGGSFDIREQLRRLALLTGEAERHDYLGLAGRMDNVLRICGFPPTPGEAGHIWGVFNQRTSESHGPEGHAGGVRPRNYDYHSLVRPDVWVYEVAAGPVVPVSAPPPAPPARKIVGPVIAEVKDLTVIQADGKPTTYLQAVLKDENAQHWIRAATVAEVFHGVLNAQLDPKALQLKVAPELINTVA